MTRKLVKFDLRSISVMDGGRLAVAFHQALERCRADLADRPALGGVRSVTLKVNMKPIADDAGNLQSVDVTFDIKDSIPRRSTQRYNMSAGRNGMVYNDLAPEDFDQLTLPFEEPVVITGGKRDHQEQEATADVG